MARTGFNPLTCTRADLIDTVLTLSQYHYPGNIRLPAEYIPPSLAISQLYWSILQSLLVVIALNPETTGHQAWTQYPMIKGTTGPSIFDLAHCGWREGCLVWNLGFFFPQRRFGHFSCNSIKTHHNSIH